ncbi:MAG: alpha/beta hydrolase [Chloroflexi bacterium]|nr:alpha/beta hydrolase [Chloroflexota bacterium]
MSDHWPEPEHRFYQSQRLRLHYVVWGDAGKPPMMLIHGGRDHCRNWDAVAAGLTGRYAIYAPDLRGHGDSEWALGGMYSLPEFVLDVATLAASIEGPLTLIGHSLGGAIALQYAGTFPDRVAKVIAIEGWGPPLLEHQTAHVRMRQWIGHMHEMEERRPRRYPTVEDATRRMLEANPHLTPEMALHLTKHGTGRNDDRTLSWKFDNYVRIRSPYEFNLEDAQDIWAQIRSPVLLVKGAESWALDPEKDGRARVIPDRRTVMIQGAGHWVHHDQLERFLEVASQFLTDH